MRGEVYVCSRFFAQTQHSNLIMGTLQHASVVGALPGLARRPLFGRLARHPLLGAPRVNRKHSAGTQPIGKPQFVCLAMPLLIGRLARRPLVGSLQGAHINVPLAKRPLMGALQGAH